MAEDIDASGFSALLGRVAAIAAEAGVFGGVERRGDMLCCAAASSAEPATYRVERDGGRVWVSLVMADRWQSESIEADLMNTGDPITELIEEELVDQGFEGSEPEVEHFRSDDMLFTFRSAVPVAGLGGEAAARVVGQWLLAYEACFAQLGDMTADDEA